MSDVELCVEAAAGLDEGAKRLWFLFGFAAAIFFLIAYWPAIKTWLEEAELQPAELLNSDTEESAAEE
jgi:hypothetical protein